MGAIAKIRLGTSKAFQKDFGKNDSEGLDSLYYLPIKAVIVSENCVEYRLDLSGLEDGELEYFNDYSSRTDRLVITDLTVEYHKQRKSLLATGKNVDVNGNSWWQDSNLIVKSFEIVDGFPAPNHA